MSQSITELNEIYVPERMNQKQFDYLIKVAKSNVIAPANQSLVVHELRLIISSYVVFQSLMF